jgi:hypothetical protein
MEGGPTIELEDDSDDSGDPYNVFESLSPLPPLLK